MLPPLCITEPMHPPQHRAKLVLPPQKGESQTRPVPAEAQLEPGYQLTWDWVHPKIWASPGAAWPGGRHHSGEHPLTCSNAPAAQGPSQGWVRFGGVEGEGLTHLALGRPQVTPILPPPHSVTITSISAQLAKPLRTGLTVGSWGTQCWWSHAALPGVSSWL